MAQQYLLQMFSLIPGKNKFQVRYFWIFVTVIGTGQHRVQDT